MFGGEFTRGANGARPVELNVCPIAKPHFLFEKTNQLTRFAGIDQPGTLCLSECVEDLNALPRSPENLRVTFAVEESDCGRVVCRGDICKRATRRCPRRLFLERAHEDSAIELRRLRVTYRAFLCETASHAQPCRFDARCFCPTISSGRRSFHVSE